MVLVREFVEDVDTYKIEVQTTRHTTLFVNGSETGRYLLSENEIATLALVNTFDDAFAILESE